MRNAQAHKLQWSGPTVHSSTVAQIFINSNDDEACRSKALQ